MREKQEWAVSIDEMTGGFNAKSAPIDHVISAVEREMCNKIVCAEVTALVAQLLQ